MDVKIPLTQTEPVGGGKTGSPNLKKAATGLLQRAKKEGVSEPLPRKPKKREESGFPPIGGGEKIIST